MGYLYFPKKKGMVTGVVLMGYGLASLIFGLTFFSLVNPHNLKAEYDDEHLNKYFKGKSESVALEVPKVLRKMSFYYIILYAIGASLIFYHPNQAGEEERRLKEALIE